MHQPKEEPKAAQAQLPPIHALLLAEESEALLDDRYRARVIDSVLALERPEQVARLRAHLETLQQLVLSHPRLCSAELYQLSLTNLSLLDFFHALESCLSGLRTEERP